MSLRFMPALLIATLYAVVALPTPNTTSAAVDTPSTPASCNDIHKCRTLFGLIWSCLSTVFLCTWVTVHPNVPSESEAGWKDRLWDHISSMMTMLAAPEVAVVVAYSEWTRACALITQLTEKYPGIQWTEAHGMMMKMGGIRVVKEDDLVQQHTKLSWTKVDQFSLYEIDFSTVAEDVIMDRSKGETIAKLLILLQTFWFATQCAARVARGLPVTELELATLGQTAFVGMIYFFWWKKPLDVRYPIILQAKRRKGDGTSSEVSHGAEGEVSGEAKGVSDGNGMESHTDLLLKTSTVNDPKKPHKLAWRIRFGNAMFSLPKRPFARLLLLTYFVAVSSVFGMIHCLGWNSHFPSHVQQIFWRVAALTVTIVPATMVIVQVSLPNPTDVNMLVLCILAFIYICARISLITIAFTALQDLPYLAYKIPSWTNFIPHL